MTAATKPAESPVIDLNMDDDDDDDKQPIPSSPRPKLEPPDPVVMIEPESGDLMRHSQMEGIPGAPTNIDSSTSTAEEGLSTVEQGVQSHQKEGRKKTIELTT